MKIENEDYLFVNLRKATKFLLRLLKASIISHELVEKLEKTLQNIFLNHVLFQGATNLVMIPI